MHITQETAGNSIVTNRAYSTETGNLLSVAAGPSYSVFNASYTWDGVGNLLNRTDNIEGYSETFCYDALNRLTNYSLAYSGSNKCTSGTIQKSITYDTDGGQGDGNIASKSDIGTYSYTGAQGAGPHAVTQITTTGTNIDGISNPNFYYDANGNMKCVTTKANCNQNAARSYTWTSFNMAEEVTNNGGNTSTFTYTPEHQRFTQTTSSGTISYFSDPVGGIMAERFQGGSTTTWRSYIVAYGHIVAERFTQAANVTMLYFVSNHLGSTVALTNTGSGSNPYAIEEQDSYDAWGKRRNFNGSDAQCGAITSATLRGYTAQEMMDSFCLVNLNARLYDPAIGRMLSADSTVPQPLNGQAFDRYSYVMNGPASSTDPTGHGMYSFGALT